MCVDYRVLNKITIVNKYLKLMLEELLDELQGAWFFSKLDLKSGFNQIRVQDAYMHKTALRTHNGHYEYLVIPFGFTNTLMTFQSTMNDVFRSCLWSIGKQSIEYLRHIITRKGVKMDHEKKIKSIIIGLLQMSCEQRKPLAYFSKALWGVVRGEEGGGGAQWREEGGRRRREREGRRED
ncbi:hypothetical protein CR513_27761, partial [Mucuna pruriens]